MALPEHVHTFPFDAEIVGQLMTLYPSAVETERGLLLFDAGLPHKVDELTAGVEDAGFSVEDIDMVLATHQDGDHAGGVSQIVDRSDATVIAHETAAPVVDGREQPRTVPDEGRYPPARVDVEFDGKLTINTCAGPAEVIETPGHTPGHVSVYFPDERFLVAGDALGIYPEVGLAAPEDQVTMDPDRALNSIERLADLDVDSILCYHGGLTDSGTERLREIVTADPESPLRSL